MGLCSIICTCYTVTQPNFHQLYRSITMGLIMEDLCLTTSLANSGHIKVTQRWNKAHYYIPEVNFFYTLVSCNTTLAWYWFLSESLKTYVPHTLGCLGHEWPCVAEGCLCEQMFYDTPRTHAFSPCMLGPHSQECGTDSYAFSTVAFAGMSDHIRHTQMASLLKH